MRARIGRIAAIGVALLVPPLALAACGGGDDERSLLVFAASSLEEAMTEYAESFPDAKVETSFAGSDALAAQIRQGATPDLYASADAAYPAQLYREGLVGRPRAFAGNRLVLAVPAGSEIDSLADLSVPGVKLVIGSPSVPVGAYTRTVLDRLGGEERRAILDNVSSEEPEVGSVVAKLQQGAADAGFVYTTDVRGVDGELRTVAIDPDLQPDVTYTAAIVEGGEETLARRYLDGLIDGEGAADLRRAGFLPPP